MRTSSGAKQRNRACATEALDDNPLPGVEPSDQIQSVSGDSTTAILYFELIYFYSILVTFHSLLVTL